MTFSTNEPSANADAGPPQRAAEADELITAVKELVTAFIRNADEDTPVLAEGHGLQIPGGGPRSVLLEHHPAHRLESLLDLSLPDTGLGKDGFITMIQKILQYSVNTWDQGFLDKLYSSTTPAGLATDLLLSALNTNVHVYQVSPALTLVEKHISRALAAKFGFTGSHAGGVSQPGGSAANQSSLVIARNNLFPETKTDGYGNRRFVLFTSAHGHYSIEKAAQISGFGSKAVRSIAVDEKGRMRPDALEAAITAAREAGETPFYVNATAGTTVLGAYDPLNDLADICQRHHLWLHVDASWGGPAIFSTHHQHQLAGISRADTVSISPHKMLGVPLTCAFLLGSDLRQFHQGMTLPAGYLFHNDSSTVTADSVREFHDLGDLVPQCGRRGDSLKLAMTWVYYGTGGLTAHVDNAFSAAAYLAEQILAHPDFTLVSENPPPCLQVCFYYRKQQGSERSKEVNSDITAKIVAKLIPRGFMTDYAPGDAGKFFRVVVNGQTRSSTIDGLLKAITAVGEEVVADVQKN